MTFCFILKHKITLFSLLPFVSNRFITRCHSLSLIVIFCYSLSFVVIRCHSLSFVVVCCHSLSLFVACCHFLYQSLSLVVIRCTTRCHSLHHSLSFVVTRCTIRFQSLSLDTSLACLFINDHEASRIILVYQVVRCHNDGDFEE